MKQLIRECFTVKTAANAIEKACHNIMSEVGSYGVDVGRVIKQVVAHWKRGDLEAALRHVEWADKKAGQKHRDLKCVLGRAYLALESPDPRRAEVAFREADQLGCKREELYMLWIKAKVHARRLEGSDRDYGEGRIARWERRLQIMFIYEREPTVSKQ